MMILIKKIIIFRISCGKTSTFTRIMKENKFSQEKCGHFWESLQQITMKIILSARLTQDPQRTKCHLSAISTIRTCVKPNERMVKCK
jgi:hypothetical protein